MSARPVYSQTSETIIVTPADLRKLNIDLKDYQRALAELPRSPYKVFIQSFCDPDRLPLPVKVDPRGKITVDEQFNLADFPAEKYVDPNLVSATLLRGVGIIAQKAKKPEINAVVLEKLRAVFNCLEPIPHTNERVWVVTRSGADLSELEQQCPGLHGSLFYIRDRVNSHQKVPMHFVSIVTAIRKNIHQRALHEKELAAISELATDVQGLRDQAGTWGTLGAEERRTLLESAQAVAQKAEGYLGYAILDGKVKAKKQTVSAAKLSDRRGRINPSACWASLHAAADKLVRRSRSIHFIMSANQEDHSSFISCRSAESAKFNQAERSLPNKEETPLRMRSFTNGERALSEVATVQDIDGFMNNIGLGAENLSSIVLRPYLTFRQAIEANHQKLLAAALAKNTELGCQIVKRMNGIVQLLRFQENLDGLAEILTTGVDSLSKFKKNLLVSMDSWRAIQSKQLVKDVCLEKYCEGVAEALQACHEMANSFTEEPSEKEFKKLKDSLAAISIEKLVSQANRLGWPRI